MISVFLIELSMLTPIISNVKAITGSQKETLALLDNIVRQSSTEPLYCEEEAEVSATKVRWQHYYIDFICTYM